MKYLGRELTKKIVQTLTEHYKIGLEEIEMNLINGEMDCVHRWDDAVWLKHQVSPIDVVLQSNPNLNPIRVFCRS